VSPNRVELSYSQPLWVPLRQASTFFSLSKERILSRSGGLRIKGCTCALSLQGSIA